MPYTPTPLDLVTPADSNHSCFEKVNQNFTDINTGFTEIASLVAGGFDFSKTGLTGGTTGCLDEIDGDDLSDGDKAIVIVGNNPARTYIYALDADNAAAEDSPYIIAPDTNPGDKRWVLSARIPRTWKGTGTPTATDDYNDGVRNGDWWLYGGNAYMCVSETAGSAVWRMIPQLGTGAINAAAGDHNHSTVNIASTAISDWAEAVQDTAGAMVSGNTETGLSISYDDASGKLNASVTYGTDANTACQGNDSRLSNSRTPTAHSFIDTTGHSASGLTTGHVVQATGATTYGFGDLGSVVYGATAKTAPVDGDYLALADSETSPAAGLLKKLSWSYVKSTLKTYFDPLYAPLSSSKVPTANLGSGTADSTTYLRGDQTWAILASGNNFVTVTAGETLAKYDIVYINTSDSNKAYKAVNNGTLMQSEVLGMVTETGGIGSGSTGQVIVNGTQTYVSWSWTPNKWLYLDSTSGALTQTLTTVNGRYAVPVAIALSATQIYIQPMTGWVVSNANNITLGFKAVSFNQASGTVAIVTPPANAVITNVTAVVSSAASGSGGTITVGTASSVDAVMASTSVDLMNLGTHTYDAYYSVGASPVQYNLTVTAGSQTFSGTLYFHYAVPNVYIGSGGMASVAFTQATSSPALIATLPTGAVVTRCSVVVSSAASASGASVSIGPVGTPASLMATTDSDLMNLGTYIYDPYVANSSATYLTITPASQSFSGTVYLHYQVTQ